MLFSFEMTEVLWFKNFSNVFSKNASDNISLYVTACTYISKHLFYFQISSAIAYAHYSLKWKGILYYYKIWSLACQNEIILFLSRHQIFSHLPLVTSYWNGNWHLEECMKQEKLVSNSLIFRCLFILFIFSPRNERYIFM